MPRTYSSIDKIRAQLAWVTETPDPNKCGCRNVRCRFTFEESTQAAWFYEVIKAYVTEVIVCDPRRNKVLGDGSKADSLTVFVGKPNELLCIAATKIAANRAIRLKVEEAGSGKSLEIFPGPPNRVRPGIGARRDRI